MKNGGLDISLGHLCSTAVTGDEENRKCLLKLFVEIAQRHPDPTKGWRNALDSHVVTLCPLGH